MKKLITIFISFVLLFISSCSLISVEHSEVRKALNVPKKYSSKKAIENGDLVNVHGNITNIHLLDKFIDDISEGKESLLRITSYTIEGDPIIAVLYYYQDKVYYYKDSTRDKYGSGSIDRYEGSNLIKIEEDGIFKYYLYNIDEHVKYIFAYRKN